MRFTAAGGGVFAAPPVIAPVTVEDSATPLVPSATVKWFQFGGVGGLAPIGASQKPALFWGDDSPEGVLAAGVGSMALRRNGAAGSTLYIKESGTGNTGWVAK
jgi:hypothetical protein